MWSFRRRFALSASPRFQARPFRPTLEVLEGRSLPSTVSWIAGNGDFGTAANWQDSLDGSHHVPGPGDDAVIGNGNATVTVAGAYSMNDLRCNALLRLDSGSISVANVITDSYIAQLVLAAGATLQTTGGTTTITSGSNISGIFDTFPGATLGFTGGANTINGGTAFNNGGEYYVSGGTFNVFGSNQQAPSDFRLLNGTLGGTGTFRVPSGATFTWDAGTQLGPGVTQIDFGGIFNLVSGNKKPLDGRIVNNSGTAVITPADTYGMDTGDNAVWNNLPGSLFDIQADDGIFHFFGSNPGLTINNSGTFRKSNSNGVFIIVDGDVLNNAGTLDLQTGTLNLAGGGSNTGSINLSPNTFHNVSSNDATLTLASGTTINGTGQLHVTGGHVNVTADVSVANTALDGGSIDGTATYTDTGSFSWTAGGMGGAGTTVVSPTATLTMSGTNDKYLDGHVGK
jgi:hypothetical protein